MTQPLARNVYFALTIGLFLAVGCSRYELDDTAFSSQLIEDGQVDTTHAHQVEAMGGVIASFGEDNYHAEAVIDADGTMVVLVLGAEITQICEVPTQQLTAYVRVVGSNTSRAMLLSAKPMPDDKPGRTSRFSGKLPLADHEQEFTVTVPGLRIDEHRYLLRFSFAQIKHIAMPEAVSLSAAQTLYLTPGGVYTAADIAANGRVTAAERYAGFVPKHDPNPVLGDWICPITKTKANPECSWILGGKTYFFCCPPCIDEFLGKAKSDPATISEPESYKHQVAPQ